MWRNGGPGTAGGVWSAVTTTVHSTQAPHTTENRTSAGLLVQLRGLHHTGREAALRRHSAPPVHRGSLVKCPSMPKNLGSTHTAEHYSDLNKPLSSGTARWTSRTSGYVKRARHRKSAHDVNCTWRLQQSPEPQSRAVMTGEERRCCSKHRAPHLDRGDKSRDLRCGMLATAITKGPACLKTAEGPDSECSHRNTLFSV